MSDQKKYDSTDPKDFDFEMTGISQVKINTKWIWITVASLVVFFIIAGTMLVISAQSRPATINSGGYTGGEEW
ncbi:MAG: hypothetical protein COB46_11055 [Rhodospirillaceae bacterium]|nr:MAG: hypothetical protein COB46_11055 [Rhodospirillaceae bacterium]